MKKIVNVKTVFHRKEIKTQLTKTFTQFKALVIIVENGMKTIKMHGKLLIKKWRQNAI